MKTVLTAALALALGIPASAEAGKAALTKTARPQPSPTQLVTVEQIRDALLRHLEKQTVPSGLEFEVTVLSPGEPFKVPNGTVDLKFRQVHGDELTGRRAFQLSVVVGAREVQNVRVTAQVEAQAEVVTATRYIKPDDTITDEDVTTSRITLPPSLNDFAFQTQDIVGKRSVRPVQADRPIRLSFVSAPYAVRKGDHVTIEARRGGLVIRTIGITKTPGQTGQQVTVTNQESGKELRAKVLGPGLVQVEF